MASSSYDRKTEYLEERDRNRKRQNPDMQRNNPNNEPVGNYTRRCRECGSRDLWDDNVAYGCKSCGAFLGGN